MALAFAATPENGLASLLIKVALIFFFIVLPIVRSVIAAWKKQQETGSKPAASAEEEELEERAAKQRWEELLRGETSAAPPPAVPLPVRPPIVPLETRTRRVESRVDVGESEELGKLEELEARLPDEESEPDLARSLTSLPNASMDTAPAAPASRTFAEERVERRAAETRRREEFERPNVEAPTRDSAREPGYDSMSPIAAFDEVERDLVLGQAGRRRELLDLGGDRRAALQRAIVATEVLGRPVGMRTGSEELGPLALRR